MWPLNMKYQTFSQNKSGTSALKKYTNFSPSTKIVNLNVKSHGKNNFVCIFEKSTQIIRAFLNFYKNSLYAYNKYFI